jgi:hypothetical protein
MPRLNASAEFQRRRYIVNHFLYAAAAGKHHRPAIENPASNAEIVSHAAGATPTSFVTFSEISGKFIVKIGFGSRFR